MGGSPQTFQTGESYLGAPLINYQHPHEFVMGLGATCFGSPHSFHVFLRCRPNRTSSPHIH